ncbi:MAG: hypothetical protein M1376_05860 [Planctomycetes bacterium]|nr:hypothetical protein [Planctomycetota bacterium]
MNRNRKIVVVVALGVVALAVTGWSMLAGAAWPPEPYQEFSPAGTWSYQDGSGAVVILTLSPVDLETGMGSGMTTPVTMDPTLGGAMPQATSLSHGFGTIVKIGPNTYRTRGINYVLKDGKPKPTILGMLVWEGTATLTTADTVDVTWDTYLIYSAAADKDSDGLPDAGEQPLVSLPPFQAQMKRI